MPAYLNVENPNNQYAEFRRSYEATALPSAPTQPVVLATTSNSVIFSWPASSHSGHSPIRSYAIEYLCICNRMAQTFAFLEIACRKHTPV